MKSLTVGAALLALLIALLAATPAALAAAPGEAPLRPDSPLRVRNLSPATQIFGLPRALGAVARRGETEVTLTVEHANNFTAATTGAATIGDGPGALPGLAVRFDGSTTVSTLALRGALGARLEWGLAVPHVLHSGGITDGFIENFHGLFGFPGGGREDAPRDRLSYRIVQDGSEVVAVEEAGGHLGDLRGWLGLRLTEGDRQAAVRTMIKAPTGRIDDLSGSEGTDVAAWLELVDRRTLAGAGMTLTLMGGVTALGDGELAEADREDLVWSGHLGLHLPVASWLTLRAQLDAHSDVIDTDVRQLSAGAVQGTLGGSLALSRGAWLDLGVTEDLTGASAPDVVFLMTLGTRL